MPEKGSIIKIGKIEQRILLIRGEKIIIDAGLAEFYNMPTKRFNEQAKRNKDRFPLADVGEKMKRIPTGLIFRYNSKICQEGPVI